MWTSQAKERNIIWHLAIFGLWSGTLLAQGAHSPGSPLLGLTASQNIQFQSGRERFLKQRTAADGLGPGYNGNSCAGCHDWPAIGGLGNISVIRAGIVRNGHYEPPVGGDLVHLFSIGDHACQDRIPMNANNLARRIPIPLFGAGPPSPAK